MNLEPLRQAWEARRNAIHKSEAWHPLERAIEELLSQPQSPVLNGADFDNDAHNIIRGLMMNMEDWGRQEDGIPEDAHWYDEARKFLGMPPARCHTCAGTGLVEAWSGTEKTASDCPDCENGEDAYPHVYQTAIRKPPPSLGHYLLVFASPTEGWYERLPYEKPEQTDSIESDWCKHTKGNRVNMSHAEAVELLTHAKAAARGIAKEGPKCECKVPGASMTCPACYPANAKAIDEYRPPQPEAPSVPTCAICGGTMPNAGPDSRYHATTNSCLQCHTREITELRRGSRLLRQAIDMIVALDYTPRGANVRELLSDFDQIGKPATQEARP